MEADFSVQLLENSRFWIQRVLVPIMVFIGVGGNTITVMVLTRKRMRCSTNIYLTALAVADVIYLLFVLVLSFSHYSNIHDRRYELYWRFFGLTHWLCDAASSASVWLTVSFTLERYIAVCHPIKGKVLCTENRAKSIIVILTILCILTTASTTFEYQLTLDEHCIRNCSVNELKKMQLSSGNSFKNTTTIHYLPNHTIVLTNVQKSDLNYDQTKLLKEIYSNLQPQINNLFPINCTSHPHIIYLPIYPANSEKNNHNLIERQVDNKEEYDRKFNETTNLNRNETENATTCCLKKYTIDTEYTNLGSNKTYKTAMYWFSAIGFGLLPLVLIATFNCFLIHAVYRSQKRRKQMTNSQENMSMSNENRITVMLIGVVVLFLICQTPTASFLIFDNFHESTNPSTRNIKLALGNIFNFLITVNAACNFILYCVLSKKYRATFKILFCQRRKLQDTIITSTRTSNRFNPYKNGLRRNISEYHTPRNLETISLMNMPRSKSLIVRPPDQIKQT